MIEGKVAHTYWRNVVNTIVYTINRIQLRFGAYKTPYELWFGNVPTVKYFRIFGSKCYIKRDKAVGKFDARSDEGIFLGYSTKSKAYRCFNLRLKKIIESAHVKIDEKFMVQERYHDYSPMIEEEPKPSTTETVVEEMFDSINLLFNDLETSEEETQKEDESVSPKIPKFTSRYHSKNDIIGDQSGKVITRSQAKNLASNEVVCLLSQIQPLSVEDACNDLDCHDAMKEELGQIIKNDTWELVPRPSDKNVIGTKWIFKNKMNEDGTVVRNKEMLVCKGYAQRKGIDYSNTFAPVSRLEAIKLFLAYAIVKNFKVYQMDVKSVFLNGEIKEEVYIEQLERFTLSDIPDMVCRLKKVLYGLKQAPRAWYERLNGYLTKIGFKKGAIDCNLIIRETFEGLLFVAVFVDDIIFGGNDKISAEFAKEMQSEFEMIMIGPIKYFLGLNV